MGAANKDLTGGYIFCRSIDDKVRPYPSLTERKSNGAQRVRRRPQAPYPVRRERPLRPGDRRAYR